MVHIMRNLSIRENFMADIRGVHESVAKLR
jgi:hypothetical protein